MMRLVVFCFSAFLSLEAYAMEIVPQPTTSFSVKQGHWVIIPFNYTLNTTERDKVLTLGLEFNGTAAISYVEIRGTIFENNTLGPLMGRADVQILSSPRTFVGLLIQQTVFSDTGRYTWSITIDAKTTLGTPIDLIIGNKPGSALFVHRHVGGMEYTLNCTVTGGIPSPNITILNGTEVIQTSSASTTTINVTVEFTTVFYCKGTNALGSTNLSSLQLPILTTTMSPTTSTVTTTRDNTAPITSTSTEKTQTGNNTGKSTTPAMGPGGQGDPPPNTALIVGVICGCVGGAFIIGILVYVFKKKRPKTKPGKKELTLEHRDVEGNDNTCAQEENSPKLSTEQEQEKKQQKNVKGCKHNLGPKGNTKPAGRDGCNKREFNADSNAEDTEQEQEAKQQRSVKGRAKECKGGGNTKPAGVYGRKKQVSNADPNEEETEQEQEAKQQRSAKGPRGNTKPAGGDGCKKRVANADPNAEETEQEQEAKQQLNVEGLQYADLDLRPTGKPKPAGGDGRNKLVFNDDSHVEYAEVRKV